MQVQTSLQPAYVLHRRPYSNTSLLLELFTREEGRLPAVAKGARAGRRRGSGLAQPFVPMLVALSGRGEVKTIRHLDQSGRGAALEGRTLYCGLYVNELLMALLGRCDASPGLFDCYTSTLERLAGHSDPEPWLRRFEVDLLRELGYALPLEWDAQTGQAVEAARRYRYDVERGPIEVDEPAAQSGVSGETLLALAGRGALGPSHTKEARRLMRTVLAYYLDGRPIRSREFFGVR